MAGTVPTLLPRRRGASATQIRAVYAVMRLLAEDDRARGVSAEAQIECAACRRTRPAAGSVAYDGARLCNGCATDFELLRIGGQVDSIAEYVR